MMINSEGNARPKLCFFQSDYACIKSMYQTNTHFKKLLVPQGKPV